jgi:spectinomycin phosphotransferase
VTEPQVVDALARGWSTKVRRLRYFPEGAGAYHWIAHDGDGRRWFVTCDDLDTKPWLGATRDEVFDGLRRAYATAAAVRSSGLGFVAAPVASGSGSLAERLDERHSVSLSEYVEGAAGAWGRPVGDDVVSILAALHVAARPEVALERTRLEVPGRAELETALGELDRPWATGPFAESARQELGAHALEVEHALERLDAIASQLEPTDSEVVVTHGEPHPGNLIRTTDGLSLVDWDTVAIARPERDLWMLDGGGGLLSVAYTRLTGRALEPEVLRAYRTLWALTDLAAYTTQLRRPHDRDADSARALEALCSILHDGEPAPYGGIHGNALR